MIETLKTVFESECLLDPSRPVLIGLSGGADSLCLLHVLWRLGYSLVVAHYNHGLRPEADADADQAAGFALMLNIPFISEKGAVRDDAQAQHLSIEEAARLARYRFLFSQADHWDAQAVAVAHTADDQVETFLMHLLRGSGPSGLIGMRYRSLPNPWSRDIPLVRPLLGTWRSQVEAYVMEQGLAPVMDATNLDPTFFRNRLRQELIPNLETYNPQVKKLIWQTAELILEDEAVLEAEVESAWSACLAIEGEGALALSAGVLRELPVSLQRRIFRKAVNRLRPSLRDFSYETVNRGLDFLTQPSTSKQIDLSSGLRLISEGDRLWIAGWEAELPGGGWPAVAGNGMLELAVPGKVYLMDGWEIRAGVLESPSADESLVKDYQDPFQAWLDLDRLESTLTIRSRRPGDRFRPLGMDGHSLKISDYFINTKLPRRARSAWPLVLSGSEIAWVPGFTLAHPFRITAETQRVVHLCLDQVN